jgi:alpha-beta hydrolase superfamily lysophospholipase
VTRGKAIDGTRPGAGGVELFWRGWVPDDAVRGVVVVAHGLGEHSGRYGNVVDALVPAGYAVYAVDHRGHGRSSGARAYVERLSMVVDDFEGFRADVAARHPGVPRFVLGHSFGGLVALAHAIDHPGTSDGLVLSGAASASGARTSLVTVTRYRILGTVWPTRPVLSVDASAVSRDPAVVEAYRADPLVCHGAVPVRTVAEMRARARRIPGEAAALRMPMLVLHGGDDALVPADASRLLAASAGSPDLELRVYDGLAHEIFNEPDHGEVLAEVVEWLDAHTGGGSRKHAG